MRAVLLALALAACSGANDTQTEAPAQPAEQPVAEASEENSVEAALAQMPRWEEARAAGVDFRGVGQEPGWLIDIYQRDKIRLLWDYGEHIADFPLTAPSYPQEGATRYTSQSGGRSLTVTIRRFPCSDIMSGENYPSTVEVVIDGRTLEGCGRSV